MQVSRNEAYGKIAHQAVGVGEEHGDPAGVEMIVEAIKAKFVRRLFIELQPAAFKGSLNAAQLKVTEQEGACDEHDPVVKFLTRQLLALHCLSYETFPLVLTCAFRNNIEVHCADINSLGLLKDEGGSDEGVQTRNESSIALVKQVTNSQNATDDGARGSVLLFGSEHFSFGEDNLVALYPGLVWWDSSLESDDE